MNIDFGRPFTFVFEDQDWLKKIAFGALYILGALLCFTGLFAMAGYSRRVLQATAESREVPLPEFNIGEDFVEGLKVFVIHVVYLLPAILIQLCSGIAQAALGAQGGDGQEMAAVVSIASTCLALPLNFAGMFLAPLGLIRYVNSGSLGDAFQVGEVFGFAKGNFTNVLLAFVVGMAGQVISTIGFFLCVLPFFPAAAYASIAKGNAYGQVLRLARQTGQLPSPAAGA